MVEKILNALKENNDKYNSFGIRTMYADHDYEAGESIPDSYDWDIENDVSTRETTGETLSGACAIEIAACNYWLDGSDDEEVRAAIEHALEMSKGYPGSSVYLIAGNGSEYGNDPEEIIISSAEALLKIK